MELMALVVAGAAMMISLIALGFALGARGQVSYMKAQLEHGITREDIDKLHHRVNVLVEKMGGLQASATAQQAQTMRIETYLLERN
jgi:CHASE1-domain containing sensor protein